MKIFEILNNAYIAHQIVKFQIYSKACVMVEKIDEIKKLANVNLIETNVNLVEAGVNVSIRVSVYNFPNNNNNKFKYPSCSPFMVKAKSNFRKYFL